MYPIINTIDIYGGLSMCKALDEGLFQSIPQFWVGKSALAILLAQLSPLFALLILLLPSQIHYLSGLGVSEGLQGVELGLRSSQGFSCRAGSLLLLSSPHWACSVPWRPCALISAVFMCCYLNWNISLQLLFCSDLGFSFDFSLGVTSLMSILA